MKLNLKDKIRDFIRMGRLLGLIDESNIDLISSRLVNISIEEDCTLPGDAQLIQNDGSTTLKINPNKLTNKPYYFLDEVIFHELTHAVSEVNIAIADFRDHNTGKITAYKDYVEDMRRRYNYNNPNRLAKYPEWGFLLLDEAIAQQTAQAMVECKYSKKIYNKEAKTSIIYPDNVYFYTTFADYPEYEKPANYFSQLVVGNDGILGMSNLAFRDKLLDKIYKTVDYNELYDILGYMGNIAIAEYAARGKFTLPNSEELRNKDNVSKSLRYVIDKTDKE
jgi:hypothetical protein